jgi:hypothetical protein
MASFQRGTSEALTDRAQGAVEAVHGSRRPGGHVLANQTSTAWLELRSGTVRTHGADETVRIMPRSGCSLPSKYDPSRRPPATNAVARPLAQLGRLGGSEVANPVFNDRLTAVATSAHVARACAVGLPIRPALFPHQSYGIARRLSLATPSATASASGPEDAPIPVPPPSQMQDQEVVYPSCSDRKDRRA